MATRNKNSKKVIVTVPTKMETVKNTAKDINDFVLETSEVIVDKAIVRGEQWQNVAGKAFKGSLKLAANQQDMIFTALETLKVQIKGGADKFKTRFSKN